MGVPGLWELLRPAAARTSLTTLTRDAFLSNKNGLRAFVLGIDASIWIFHAQVPQHGENPFLRTIFFKITTLLSQPVLPVFVFDGPHKPSQKRNQYVSGRFGTGDHQSKQFKDLLDVCGLEWWNAPGEAEAELAIMNRQGKIDAVLTDDVDALLFGAKCVVRNNSPTLTGSVGTSTQSTSSRTDQRPFEVYHSTAIRDLFAEKEDTELVTEEDCRMALVFIALLRGGDYSPSGFEGIGTTIANGLAHAGHSKFLHSYLQDPARFKTKQHFSLLAILEELRTNSTGHIGRKNTVLAQKLESQEITKLFPPVAIEAYLRPTTSQVDSPEAGWPGFGKGQAGPRRGRARNEGRGDLEGMAKAMEKFFEFGTKEIVARRFATESMGVFQGEFLHQARRAVRMQGEVSTNNDVGSYLAPQSTSTAKYASGSQINSFFQTVHSTNSSATSKLGSTLAASSSSSACTDAPVHSNKIHGDRSDPTNADLSEYRLSFNPQPYINRCHAAMSGDRVDPKDLPAAKRAELGLVDHDDNSASHKEVTVKNELRVWVPEYLVKAAYPGLIEAYREEKLAKAKLPLKKRAPMAKSRSLKAVESVDSFNVNTFKDFFQAGPSQAAPPQILKPVPTQTSKPVKAAAKRVEQRRVPIATRRSASVDFSQPINTSLSLSPPSTPRKSAQQSTSAPFTPVPSILGVTRPAPPSSASSNSSSIEIVSRVSKTRSRPRSKLLRVTSSPSGSSQSDPSKSKRLGKESSSRQTTNTTITLEDDDQVDVVSQPKSSQNSSEPIDLTMSSDEETPKAKLKFTRRTFTKSISLPTHLPPVTLPKSTFVKQAPAPLAESSRETTPPTVASVSAQTSPTPSPSRSSASVSVSPKPRRRSPRSASSTRSTRKIMFADMTSKATSPRSLEPVSQGKLNLQVLRPAQSTGSKPANGLTRHREQEKRRTKFVMISETSDEEFIDIAGCQ